MVERQIGIGQSLGLNALGGVHDQNGALAGGQAAADLIAEVHMPRRVDEVERVILTVLRMIGKADGAGFDGDAVLTLKIHIIKNLFCHISAVHRPAKLNKAVRQSRFSVIYMGDDGKIPDMILWCHLVLPSVNSSALSTRVRSSATKPRMRSRLAS